MIPRLAGIITSWWHRLDTWIAHTFDDDEIVEQMRHW